MNDQREFDTLLRSWLDESAPAHEPARLLDTVLATTAGLRPRRRWVARLAGAGTLKQTTREPDRFSPIALASAVLLVAVLVAGIVWGLFTAPVGNPPAPSITPPTPSGTSGPSATVPYIIPPPTSGPGLTPEEPGTYRMRGPGEQGPAGWPASVIVTIPEGWYARSAVRGGGLARSEDDQLAGLNFSSVHNLVADPCSSSDAGLEPAVGSSVADLVAGLRSLPGLEFDTPVDVTLDGWAGTRLELTHPAGCGSGADGRAELWVTTPAFGGESWTANSLPGWHTTLWILDIDGLRFVVIAAYELDAPEDVRLELEHIVDSIDIEP